MMRRLLATTPGAYQLPQLLAEARAAWPGVNVGEYGPIGSYQLALYLPDDSTVTQSEWAALVAAHVPADPVAVPTLEERIAAFLDGLENP